MIQIVLRLLGDWWAALFLVLAIAFGFVYCSHQLKPPIEVKCPDCAAGAVATLVPSFTPLRITNLVITPERVQIGQRSTLLNGICNDSSDPIAVHVVLGAIHEGVDPLSIGANTTLVPAQGSGKQFETLNIPAGPACISQEPIVTEQTPAILPVGKYHIYLQLEALGPRVGDVQRISRDSNSFEIIDGR